MVVWLLLPLAVQAADVCYPNKLAGAYAFELAGDTTISGSKQPAVALGRITFDSNGKISGTSSVKFAGYLLGNPVNGTYQAHQDCTVTWQLQDDSGAYQHFSGKFTPDGTRVEFRQTDSGGVRNGIMRKTGDSCNSSDLKPRYRYTASGSTIAMLSGQAGFSVASQGVIDTVRQGDFQVDSDCGVHFTLTLPSGTVNVRGFLVDGGKGILAFETDPGAMVSVRLTAVP